MMPGLSPPRLNYFSIQTTGLGDSPKPPGGPFLAKNGVTSPLSVSTNTKVPWTSPMTINLAEELISAVAVDENG